MCKICRVVCNLYIKNRDFDFVHFVKYNILNIYLLIQFIWPDLIITEVVNMTKKLKHL